MPALQELTAIFLDTHVFHERAFDFQSPHFRQLKELVDSGVVRIVLTDITTREIEAHISDKATEAYNAFQKLQRMGAVKNLRQPPFDAMALGTSVENIRKELLNQFNAFCREAKVEVISSDEEDVLNASLALKRYFDHKPPFGRDKKKSEFPDAFAAQLLKNWCLNHDATIHVVTGDSDWKALCEERIEPFRFCDNLMVLLASFPDPAVAGSIKRALEARSGELQDAIDALLPTLSFAELNVRVTEVKILSIRFGPFYVTSVKKQKAKVEAECEITFEADVRLIDPKGNGYDSEGRRHAFDDRFADVIEGTVNFENTNSVIVEVKFDTKDPSQIELARVTLEHTDIGVDCSELLD